MTLSFIQKITACDRPYATFLLSPVDRTLVSCYAKQRKRPVRAQTTIKGRASLIEHYCKYTTTPLPSGRKNHGKKVEVFACSRPTRVALDVHTRVRWMPPSGVFFFFPRGEEQCDVPARIFACHILLAEELGSPWKQNQNVNDCSLCTHRE